MPGRPPTSPETPTGGRRPAPADPRLRRFRRRWPRRLLIAANVVVAVVIATCGVGFGYVQFQFSKITTVDVKGLFGEGTGESSGAGSTIPPFTLLAVGSDTRNIPGGSQFQGSGANATTGQRSDSIILVRVNPAAKAIALLSIPRDTIVPIPGVGTTRINEAFNKGTPSLLVQVLAQDFGIQVNHYAEANFDTFEQLSNAVGGVNVWFPAAAKDDFSLLRVGPGCNNLTGSLALAFVRSREYQYYLNGRWNYQQLPESDLARIQRQQAFVKLALQRARKIAPTNVVELDKLVSSITSNLTLDSTFTTSELLGLAQTFRTADLSSLPQFTYPTTNSTSQPGALSPQLAAGKAVVQQWLDVGQPAPSPAATPTTAPPATPTTVVAPGSVEIEVANGSGMSGQAATVAAALHAVGYPTTVSRATFPAQATTLVRYAPDAKAAAQQVQSELKGGATTEEDPALASTRYQLEVVTGSGYAGVVGAAAPATTSTTTAPATTPTTGGDPAINGASNVEADSSSYVNGQYVPPGRTPGQPVVTCSN